MAARRKIRVHNLPGTKSACNGAIKSRASGLRGIAGDLRPPNGRASHILIIFALPRLRVRGGSSAFTSAGADPIYERQRQA